MKNILNKKGFTLVEILVTIGLLALLGVGIGVSLNKVLKNQEENTYETFIEKIKSSSLLYSSNSETIMNDLEFNNGYVLISMNDLINGGYIRENVKNPNTNETLKELGINEKGEDYSKARVYYSMDKEMIIDYPFIKPEDDVYLNVINYTTMYKSNENNLCYKGLNTSSLGLTLVESGGLLNKDLSAGNSIIAYMEDGSKCTDAKLNTSSVGTYKIRYVYTIDGTNAENNPNAKSAVRNITIKPTKPVINEFVVKYQYDIGNSSFDPYKLQLNLSASEPASVKMKYCLVAVNENQNISDISTLISYCKYEQNDNQINNYWTEYPENGNTVSVNFNLKERFKEQENAKTLKFYIFVKNEFEEYAQMNNSNNKNGEIYLYKTVTLNPDGGKFSDSSTQVKVINVDYGTTYNIFFSNNSTYKTPSRSGYAFEGWLLNGSKINDSDMILDDVTLKAKWYKYCTEKVRTGSGSCSASCGGGSRTVYYADKYYSGVSCSNGSESCNTHACPTTTTQSSGGGGGGEKVCISPVSKQYKHECDCYIGDGIPMLIWYDSTYCYCCRSSY